MPFAASPDAMPLIFTCWTGQIGVMKSVGYGLMEMLAPVSKMWGTMSGVIGVMES